MAEIEQQRAASPSRWSALGASLAVSALGLVVLGLWQLIAEPWPLVGDGPHYLAMHDGEVAPTPFSLRVLTPGLAALLPWDGLVNFAVVTSACLAGCTGLLLLLARSRGEPALLAGLTCLYWLTSYGFVYYGTTWIRADAPALLSIAWALLLSRLQCSPWWIVACVGLGSLAHETALVALPLLWLDRLCAQHVAGGARFSYARLAWVSVAALTLFIASRALLANFTSAGDGPARISYLSDFSGVIVHVLEQIGGPVTYGMRVYAGYGPVLVFALGHALSAERPRRALYFVLVLALGVLASLLSTDTLRVMAILYVPVLHFAASYSYGLWSTGMRKLTLLALLTSCGYSLTVFGHLRSFESSRSLQLWALGFSLLAVFVCAAAGLTRARGQQSSW